MGWKTKSARRRKRSFRGIEAESKIAHSRAKRAAVLILRSKTERKRSFLRLGRTKKTKLLRHGSIARSRAKRAFFAKQNRKKARFPGQEFRLTNLDLFNFKILFFLSSRVFVF